MNLIAIIFSFFSLYLAINGILMYFFKNYLPDIMRQAFNYGKYAEKKQNQFLQIVEFPKKWFRHFYIVASPIATFCLFITIRKYVNNENVPEFICTILDLLMGSERKPLVSLSRTTLAIFLVTIQTTKRIYETQSVNIFSDGKINISHYIVGYVYYIGLIAAILGESEGFNKDTMRNSKIDSLKIKDLIGAIIFLWMSYQQLQTNIILANLRKDKNGIIVTKEHKIPRGGLFNYISAPLQFTEIGMYMALKIIISQGETYFFVCLWVVVNQFVTGLLSHQWHRNTFKDYPPSRKIIIPYLL
ncbi:polyprenol reductase-like [Leptopilina boulardi]|uniref:polyprenol reductase-like n=1 Tax=Leptopilina boulardi TaxID=63433 RepID=UPI0021F55687|nr:polyprenol reductase-like [Leptopilina boulardi]